ncbi:hypothetical protein AAG570_008037 [Ranatra chinensis]|uniref:Retinoblastoma-associated protein A-box domain-containing protein n=1 Tax=Ranatra chinensis TaxID=642074 RepID=A0ABD0YC62_9HEMI
MGLSEECEKDVMKLHQDLCKTLNLDKTSASEAWKHFCKVYDSYTLDVLKGNSNLLCDVLENNNFEYNFKNINRSYEEYVLSAGEFDERIFLGCLVTPNCESLNSSLLQPKGNSPGDQFDPKRAINFSNKDLPMTPLTARKYLEPKIVPYESSPGQIVATLQTMLCGKDPAPSEKFLKLIRSCDSVLNIECLIDKLVDAIKEKLLRSSNDMESVAEELADSCCDLAKRLFFKLMDSILAGEVEKSSFDANIEETILESLAWAHDSPLWKGIIDLGLPVPSCEDVSTQPVFGETEDSFGRQSSKSEDTSHSIDKLTLLAEAGVNPNKQLKENKKPKRTGAIALFFRKFYYLASVRMEDMCNQLGLIDKELRLKIWTCFELSIVNHVGLMLDRHLDQILMCAIYVICKGQRVVLSPLPVSKSVALNSPRRVSEKYSVFLRALGQDKSNSSSPKQLSYCFNYSPAKDLQAINHMVKCDAFRIGKKLLRDDDSDMQNCETNSGIVNRKVQGLRVDRLAAKSQ